MTSVLRGAGYGLEPESAGPELRAPAAGRLRLIVTGAVGVFTTGCNVVLLAVAGAASCTTDAGERDAQVARSS
jgi:hypothetical protein